MGAKEQLRVLVVDDEAIFANALMRLLTDHGYACRMVHSVTSAIDAIETSTFDVIVSDLQLGRSSGVTVLAAARTRAPEAITVLMTGQLDWAPQPLERSFVDAYVFKPFDIDKLVALISRARCRRSGVRVAAANADPLTGRARSSGER